MAFVSAIEAVSIEGSLKPVGVVDEKHSGFNIMHPLVDGCSRPFDT